MFYLYELRESDGNYCSVYDCIVEGANEDAANETFYADLDAKAKVGDWESDGDGGFYFPCTCEVQEEPEDDPAECTQCEVLNINGVNCHEAGCPTYAAYKRAMWRYENSDDCPGHGGLTVSLEGTYATEDEAEGGHQHYHLTYAV